MAIRFDSSKNSPHIRKVGKLTIGVGLIGVGLLFTQAFLQDLPALSMKDWQTVKAWILAIVSVAATSATFLGLYLAYQSRRDRKETVSTFSSLIDRVCDMAKEATGQDPLRILAYTPALGYLAEPTDNWFKLFSALTAATPEGNRRARIICLRRDELDVWHRLFVGRITSRGQIKLEHAEKATRAAINLLDSLRKDSEGNEIEEAVIELPWHFMPGFYLFIGKKRVLVVTPLFLPFPKGVPHQQNLPQVQIIGIEYKDQMLIRDAKQIYQFYAQLPQSALGEASYVVSSDMLESWLNNSGSTDIVEHLWRQFCDSYKRSRQEDYAAFSQVGSEVELVLRANVKTWQDGA